MRRCILTSTLSGTRGDKARARRGFVCLRESVRSTEPVEPSRGGGWLCWSDARETWIEANIVVGLPKASLVLRVPINAGRT